MAFWCFATILLFNATYPALMLTRTGWRTSIALVDIGLDLNYGLCYGCTMLAAGNFLRVLPTGALEFLSMLMPVTHILFVCRSIQGHALEQVAGATETPETQDVHTVTATSEGRRALTRLESTLEPSQNEDQNDTVHTGERKLPLSKAVWSAVLSLTAIAVVLVAKCRDRYPFINDLGLGPCAPCFCDEAMVLQYCSQPFVEITTGTLDLSGLGVTEVKDGAFDHYPDLAYVHLGKPNTSPTHRCPGPGSRTLTPLAHYATQRHTDLAGCTFVSPLH